MSKLRLNIAKLLKVIIIITITFLHIFGHLIFEYNSLNQFYKSKYQEQEIKSNNGDSQFETAFTKKDAKDLHVFLPDVEKQKSKSYLKHNSNHDANSLLTYYKEENKFYYQKVDNKNLNPRSPPSACHKI